MSRPLTATALLASALAVAATWAPPATTKYRVDFKSDQIIDLTPLGQGEQKQTFAWSSFLNMTLEDTAGGKTLDAVLDSVTVDPRSQVPAAVFDSVRGARWHGLVSPEGKVSDLKAVAERPGGGQFQGMLAGFYPRVRRGAKVGDKWADTLDVLREDPGTSMRTRTVTNYTVAGSETRGGVKALRIEAAFDVTQAGAIGSPQGPVNVDGAGKGTGTYFVAADGRFLGGNQVTSSTITAKVPSAPAPLSIQDTSTVTISVLP